MPQDCYGVQERFFPQRIAQVHGHRLEAGALDLLERGGDILDLVRDVVRTGAVAVEEPAQEVVALGLVGLEHLEAHAVGVTHLGRAEADGPSAPEERAGQVVDIARPRVLLALGGDRHMVEVDVCYHGAAVLASTSCCGSRVSTTSCW